MAGKEIKDAAERVSKRKDILRTPVYKLPDAPENLHISKEEFLKRRRAKKEEDLAVEKYRQELRSKKGGSTDGLQEEEKRVESKKVYSKKVED